MKDYVICTDGNADMSKDYAAANNIAIIPHFYQIEDVFYGDGKDLSPHEFYEALRAKKDAKTQSGNPDFIKQLFVGLAEEGKDILHIGFSSELSGAVGHVQMIANEVMEKYPDCKIIVIDTLNVSVSESILCMYAKDLKEQGKTIDEAAQWIREHIQNMCTIFTVDDLFHLYRGGRLSRTTAVIGSVVNIKPILKVDKEGKLSVEGKAKGRKKSITYMIDYMKERLSDYAEKPKYVGIVHGDCEDEAKLIEEKLKAEFGADLNTFITFVGPSVGVHSGPGALGIIFMGEKR